MRHVQIGMFDNRLALTPPQYDVQIDEPRPESSRSDPAEIPFYGHQKSKEGQGVVGGFDYGDRV